MRNRFGIGRRRNAGNLFEGLAEMIHVKKTKLLRDLTDGVLLVRKKKLFRPLDAVTASEGGVHMAVVGGVAVRGVELRQLYGLRSAAFETEVRDGKIIFYVTGYGHGVGMSQYGANEMAKQGADWRTILLHYYTGIGIEMWKENTGEAV